MEQVKRWDEALWLAILEEEVHGPDIMEWLYLSRNDFDWIDTEFYLETIGG